MADLDVYLADNVQAWELQARTARTRSSRRNQGEEPKAAQLRLLRELGEAS